VLFNSTEFLVFLGAVLALYYRLGHRSQNLMLLVASYVFYGWWDARFLSLLVLSTVVDFFCSHGIHASSDPARRLRLLRVSIAVNLGVLGFFKYFDFFTSSSVELLNALGLHASLPLLEVILPVGISFYTFQTMAYTIDVYRGQVAPARRFLDFALYVGFFPQLVAGPIERARALLPQLENPRRVDASDWTAAIQLLLLGYFKKVCIADGVAPYVDRAFADPAALSAPDLWLASYLFAIQIYGDFSGYTDIARGVARLFGIRLSVNFRQPYLSSSITDFWRRWHISLSSWLRDYLYVPLGGNRRGRRRTYANLLTTMLLGGLWHGAAWHFVIWGALHGIALAVHRAVTGGTVSSAPHAARRNPVLVTAKILLTFHLVCLFWVFFRADDAGSAWVFLAGMVGDLSAPSADLAITTLCYAILLAAVDLPCWRHERELPFAPQGPAWAWGLAFAGMLIAISFIGETNARPFIYFQF
jgi:D-alanyl-lipoteichoic acid acyltransferase DltB (MBOAT superfamily)